MNKNIVTRCKDMLLQPMRTWAVIASEPGGLKEALYPYAVVMGLIPAVMMLIAGAGMGVLMARMGGRSGAHSFMMTVGFAVISYVGGLIFTLIVGRVMAWIAPFFDARKSWVLSCRVLVYAGTPLYLAGVLGLIPILGILLVFLALPWTFILLYLGVGQVLETRGAKQLLFTVATALIFIVVGIVPMSIFSMMGRRAMPPMASPAMDPRMAGMLSTMKAESGQGTEADMQAAADAQVQQLIASGQLKPDQAANAREQILKGMRELKAEMSKAR